jgi:hypothetical protein
MPRYVAITETGNSGVWESQTGGANLPEISQRSNPDPESLTNIIIRIGQKLPLTLLY